MQWPWHPHQNHHTLKFNVNQDRRGSVYGRNRSIYFHHPYWMAHHIFMIQSSKCLEFIDVNMSIYYIWIGLENEEIILLIWDLR